MRRQQAIICDAIMQAGLPVESATINCGPTRGEPLCTYHLAAGLPIRIKWNQQPTAAQMVDIDALATTAANAQPTEDQRIDEVRVPEKIAKLIVIRMSDRWAGLSASRKAKIQATINAAADDAIASLSAQL